MPDVSAPQSIPEGEGASASMPQGAAEQFRAQNHALTSQSQPRSPGPSAGPPGAMPSPGAGPAAGPAQPPSQQQGRLDMNAVFPPMPEMDLRNQQPWRDQIRTFAQVPGNSSFRLLAEQIKDQHGPIR